MMPQRRGRSTPSRANSSGGKERLGKISKQGNKQLRTLLIVGATSVLKQARRGVKLPAWVVSLLARKAYKVAAVALANKIARTIWALLVKGGTYQAPGSMTRVKHDQSIDTSIPIRPSDAMRFERVKVIRRSASRISSWPAAMTALTGRTYDCTVRRGFTQKPSC